ncbi:alpha/beta fold hydrolase [Xanthomonas cannabis]|uniref:alpha/beta fold hydrolase n=1 Tax=Xanthomonas cannabis TaxID=1885674 RepID=UPI00141AB613|nr:alpha/beta hydrolase [Xanthomonas cannabis]NIK17057.1 pimeloyl-ACP methyl ester carboxylesterase [Xanthomonas cannabis]
MNRSAMAYFGRDYSFRKRIEGLPEKLSDVKGLEIGEFHTSDGVRLAYWTSGQGAPLVLLPGWSAGGADYINIIHLLSKRFKVYVLDQRNHGLSEKAEFGNRISRFAADLNDFLVSQNIESAHLCGWSMGCSVIWGYLDIFGSARVQKLIFIDQAPSIYSHSDWTEEQRVQAGAFATSAERMIAMYYEETPASRLIVDTDLFDFYNSKGAPAFENSHAFMEDFVPQDRGALRRVLFDHILNDWRDVIQFKIDRPTLVMSGEHSDWVQSQRWIAEVVPDGRAIIYGKVEHGDHFLHLKNPIRFSAEVTAFLEGN